MPGVRGVPCRAVPCPLGFLFLFFPSRFIPSYAKGENPLGRFAQGGGGGPYHPPSHHHRARAHLVMPKVGDDGGIGTWMSPHQTPRGCQDRARAPMDQGPLPHSKVGRVPPSSPVEGGHCPTLCIACPHLPTPSSPPPRRAPLAPALPAAFSWLHYSGEPTRVRGSPGPPRTLFPLSEIPPALWDPSLSLGWPGPPRSPLCPLHMPLAGRSLPRGVEGTGTICLQIRVLSIFKKDDVIYSPPQPLRCQPPALPGPHVCHGVPAGVMGPGGALLPSWL